MGTVAIYDTAAVDYQVAELLIRIRLFLESDLQICGEIASYAGLSPEGVVIGASGMHECEYTIDVTSTPGSDVTRDKLFQFH
jgi:hypothetical protein